MIFCFILTGFIFAKQPQTIYTEKIKNIVRAIPIAPYEKEADLYQMLKKACTRNNCNSLEAKTILRVGRQLVSCKVKHLSVHGITNSDASNICESKHSIYACDSLSTPLLRKMCYSSNRFSLQVLREKEKRILNRQPTSIKEK